MAMDWEAAFFEQYQDAYIGRQLRGIIHNLNGTNQAFSLQATLFRSLFSQAEKVLHEVESVCPEARGSLVALRDLLQKRLVMVGQMEEKVETSQRIVARTLPLAQLYSGVADCEVALAVIVDLEMEILAADSFFKHQVAKTVELAPDLPLLRRHCLELHATLFTLLENAVAAVRDVSPSVLRLLARRVDEALVIEVRDSGPGIAPDLADRIYEPFFSTKAGALGVGLYLARKSVTAMGGTLAYSRAAGETCFTVTVPLSEVA